ncbi:hypothetical protein IDG89_01080 [Pelagibacterales bacterium SAG-MED02]|nr:hypothetical protein [Pelagibacterales bacterium SAG-MED02]
MIKSILIFSSYLSILGYSTLIKKFFIKNGIDQNNSFNLIFGLIFLYFFSFLINFFFPLKFFSLYIFCIGLILSLFFFKKTFEDINFYLIFIILSLTIIIEPNSLAADTHFYHLQIIKWYTNEKAIFGIANLESRFGLISGWHHLLALFNIPIQRINFLFIFNTIPFVLLCNEVFTTKNKNSLKLYKIFLYSVFIFLMIYAIIHPTLNGTIFNTMGSADADSAGTYFFIGSFYFFLKFISEKKNTDFIFLIILVNLSYITKISNIVIILLPVYIIFFYNINLFKMKKIIFFLFLLNILWFSKIFISTGCFVFPLDLTCFNLDWSVPKNIIKGLTYEFSSYPRSKNNLEFHYHNYDYYIQSYSWFKTWFINYFIDISFIQICAVIVIISLILILKKFNFKIFLIYKNLIIFFVIFFIVNINFWLIAPDIRYAYGIFLCLTSLLFSYSVKDYLKYIKKIDNYKNVFFIFLFICLVGKNIKYQYSNDIFIDNRTFDYSNISLYKKINSYEVYKTNAGNCAFFKKICIYKDPKNLKIKRLNSYLYITNEK